MKINDHTFSQKVEDSHRRLEAVQVQVRLKAHEHPQQPEYQPNHKEYNAKSCPLKARKTRKHLDELRH